MELCSKPQEIAIKSHSLPKIGFASFDEAKEPLNNSARARRPLCGRHAQRLLSRASCPTRKSPFRFRLRWHGLGERWSLWQSFVPNKRAPIVITIRQRPRKGRSHKGFAGKAASRADCHDKRHSAV